MPRKEKSISVRVEENLAKRAESHARLIGWSTTRWCEQAIECLADMVEDPAKRVIPDMVMQADFLRAPKKKPLKSR